LNMFSFCHHYDKEHPWTNYRIQYLLQTRPFKAFHNVELAQNFLPLTNTLLASKGNPNIIRTSLNYPLLMPVRDAKPIQY